MGERQLQVPFFAVVLGVGIVACGSDVTTGTDASTSDGAVKDAPPEPFCNLGGGTCTPGDC